VIRELNKGDPMSDLNEKFQQAAVDVKTLTSRPSNEDMLALYANFKQASSGDVSGKRPGMLDIVGRAKYDAWADLKGVSSDDAKQTYINTVNRLLGR
jgi:diazepam-binding inhibitor (GABA receptor modulating acyl-CoA-binding protein)